MSDAVKWALLIAILATIVGLVLALPAVAQMVPAFAYIEYGLSSFVTFMAPYIAQAKSLFLILVPNGIKNIMWLGVKIDMVLWLSIIPIQLIRHLYAWIFK